MEVSWRVGDGELTVTERRAMKPRSEWMPDSATPQCCRCGAEFGVRRRRHHCRLCGEVVCDECSRSRVRLQPPERRRQSEDGPAKAPGDDDPAPRSRSWSFNEFASGRKQNHSRDRSSSTTWRKSPLSLLDVPKCRVCDKCVHKSSKESIKEFPSPGIATMKDGSTAQINVVPQQPGTGQWVIKKGNKDRLFGLDFKSTWKRRLVVLNPRSSIIEYFAPKVGCKNPVPDAINPAGIVHCIPPGSTIFKGCINIDENSIVSVQGRDVQIQNDGRRWEFATASESIAKSWKWELDALVWKDSSRKEELVESIEQFEWGPYAITENSLTFESLLAEGAFGDVWSAKWDPTELHRTQLSDMPQDGTIQVAVKKLKIDKVQFDELATRDFVMEGTSMRSLLHGNIIRFYGAGYTTDVESQVPYIVSELAGRGSLRSLLDKNAESPELFDLSSEKLLSICRDAACGLAYLHGLGTLHRDIKSDNLLVTDDWVGKLADFGTGKLLMAPPDVKSRKSVCQNFFETRVVDPLKTMSTWTGTLTQAVGTPLWMAPEVVQAAPSSDDEKNKADAHRPKIVYGPAADVWSFGMVLWEIVTKRLPWNHLFHENFMLFALLKAINNGERPEVPAETPMELDLMMSACWDIDPNRRPTAEEIEAGLQLLLETKISF